MRRSNATPAATASAPKARAIVATLTPVRVRAVTPPARLIA
ncbi:MAG: hypothetical protein ACLP8S_10580 [Solirubrobacteraceae bacterium]